MRRIPQTRFRRELNQHSRSNETLMITRCRKDLVVWMPYGEYTRNQAQIHSFKQLYGKGND